MVYLPLFIGVGLVYCGHAIGHAVESLTGYTQINHGEGVGIGMAAAAHIAVELGLCDNDLIQRQQQLLAKTQLPTEIPANLALTDIIEALQHDKKVQGGIVRFILPDAIGSVQISDAVTRQVIEKVLAASHY